MWGTARSLARLISPYPEASGLVRWGGTAAFATAIVLIQALFVIGVQRRQRKSVLAGAVVLVVAVVLSAARAPIITRTLRVAAVGRGRDNIAGRAEAFVAEAAKRRAKIIVFPEVEFTMASGARSEFQSHWSAIVGHHGHERDLGSAIQGFVWRRDDAGRRGGCLRVGWRGRHSAVARNEQDGTEKNAEIARHF